MFNCAIDKRLLDAAVVLDNSHNSAHNLVRLSIITNTSVKH